MTLIHFMVFMFFLSILVYLGLKNGTATVGVLNAGYNGSSNLAKTLQGR